MATTKAELRRWFDEGVNQGATHMIVVCDTFDYEDYPVYVEAKDKPEEVAAQYAGKNMQRVMEVYNLKMDREEQIASDALVTNY